MSPLAGTVEATLLTVVKFARNGPELVLEVVVEVVVLTAAGALEELLVLLELPQPATASATPTRARIEVLRTGVSPVVRDRETKRPAATGGISSPQRACGNHQHTALPGAPPAMTP